MSDGKDFEKTQAEVIVQALEYEYTEEEEKKLVRKLDLNILPYVAGAYLLGFLDRGVIGNAETAGMSIDLGITDAQYQWFLTIFYIAYIVFEFLVIFYKIFPPRVYVPTMIIGWGIFTAASAGVTNFRTMLAFRFLMGMFEAGYVPGVPYYLSFFYYRHEAAWRISLFCVAAPIATTFSGALAYGITSNTNLALAGWRVLFLVESLPTIVVGLWGYYILPNSSSDCRFLTEHEKNIAKARLAKQIGNVEMSKSFRIKDFIVPLLDLKVVIPMIMYFCINVSYSSLPVFTPAIVHGMGFTSVNSQGLSAIPYIYTTVVVLVCCFLSDRWKMRGPFIAVLSLKGAIGWLLLALCKTTGVRYFALFLAASGIFSCVPLMLTFMWNNQGSEQKRGVGYIFLNILGQSGPLVGTRLFPSSQAPFYIKGCWVSFALTMVLTVCAVLLTLYLIWVNKRLDEKYGPSEDVYETSNSVTEDGEVNQNFRYIW